VPPEEPEAEAEPGGEAEPEGERGRPAGDPLGKRALFSIAPVSIAPGEALDGTAVDADLVVGRGPITVTCSTCDAVSRIGVLDFLVYQLPVGYWVPRGRFGHRMTCPSCRRRVWAGVTLR
jgi:hypothetical protein